MPAPWRKQQAAQEAPEKEPKEVAPRLDKVEQWRYDRLIAAEYTESQALWLALDRRIDLHEAVDLAKSAGSVLAFQILS